MPGQPKTSFRPSEERLQLLARLLADEGLHFTPHSITRRKNSQEFPLSSGQHRLWFLDRLEAGIHYNDHFNLRLSGKLDIEALTRSIQQILGRHEAMRAMFTEVDGVAVQTIAPAGELNLPCIDLSKMPQSDREVKALQLAIQEARRPFNLSAGPLWRFSLIALGAEEHLLLITAHHIAIDGWSRGVFLRELCALYPALLAREPAPLPDLPIQ